MTISRLIARERARLSLAIVAQGVGIALAISAFVIALSALSLGGARWIGLPVLPLAVWGLAILLCAGAAWWTAMLLRRRATSAEIAAAIEGERELRAGSLRGALEVANRGALGRRAADSIVARLSPTGSGGGRGRSLAPRANRRAWQRVAAAGGVAVMAILVLGAVREASPDGWRAMRHPVGALTGSLLEPLEILDAPREVLRGERLRLTISAPLRRTLEVASRTTGRAWHSEEIAVRDGRAQVQLGPVDGDLLLIASDGRTRSDTVLVKVTDRPFVGDVAIRAIYPAYLKRASEVLPAGEPARIPRGTVLDVRGRASVALEEIGLTSDGDTVSLTPDGHSFNGRLSARTSGVWTWLARGADNAIPDVPAPIEVEVLADSAPTAQILAPATDTVVMAQDRIALRAAAGDDHGLVSVLMRSWRESASGAAQPSVAEEIAAPGAPEWSGQVPVDIAARGLEPGDALHLTIEARDGSPWRQTGSSRELIIRVPSLSERREMARALGDSAVAHARRAAEEQRKLERRTGDAARSRANRDAQQSGGKADPDEKSGGDMSYESAERNRALAQDQQALEKRVENLQRESRELEKQLREAGALDSALAREMRDVQKLLDQALTPEMRQQLEQLRQATKNLQSDRARQSLAELEELQKRLREQLEKSAEMLQRAALEGAMETLRDDAQELADREQAAADSMSRGARPDSKSKDMAQQSDLLKKRIDEIAERLEKEKAEAGPDKLRQASQSTQQSADAMRRAAEAGQQQGASNQGQQQSGENQQGAQAAREGAQKMQEAAQQLADARQAQVGEWKEELKSELDKSIQETLQLAREQQALADEARKGGAAEKFRARQSAVQQGTERVGERLQQQAGKSAHVSPQSQGAMGEAQRKVASATEQLATSRRGAGEAADAMDQAARALNKAAAALVQDRERAAGSQSASGMEEMLQRMQEMARQQGQINAQSASILPMPGSQAGQQAQMLGARQRALAQKLDELGKQDETGRAAALAREMREIAQTLQQGRIDASVLDRQQRLFRRLLDAGLSLEKEEREEQGERESRSATGTEFLRPVGDGKGEAAVRYREPTWSELRGLTADQRRAVIEYFRRINANSP